MIIPSDFEIGKWEKETAQNILDQLKRLTNDAFYRMAEDVRIDLDLLTESGYEFDGLSTIAVKELESCLPNDKLKEVKNLIQKDDYEMEDDFIYVFRLFEDRTGVIKKIYSDDIVSFANWRISNPLIGERESMINLMSLFIQEFKDEEEAEATMKVLNLYGGHFILITELNSFLSHREEENWYCGNTHNPYYHEEFMQLNAMRELVPLYKMLSEAGEFEKGEGVQIQSNKFKHQKIVLSSDATELLSQGLALALNILQKNSICPEELLCIDSKTRSLYELMFASESIDYISNNIESSLELYKSENDLQLFYYLADNAIQWPKDITLTKRYLFLYRLAKFFKYVDETNYDDTTYYASRKEIVEAIKYQIKQVKKRDKDGKMLNIYLGENSL